MASLNFESVSVRYGDDPPVLDDLDLELAPGEIVALVGVVGSASRPCVNWFPVSWIPIGVWFESEVSICAISSPRPFVLPLRSCSRRRSCSPIRCSRT